MQSAAPSGTQWCKTVKKEDQKEEDLYEMLDGIGVERTTA